MGELADRYSAKQPRLWVPGAYFDFDDFEPVDLAGMVRAHDMAESWARDRVMVSFGAETATGTACLTGPRAVVRQLLRDALAKLDELPDQDGAR